MTSISAAASSAIEAEVAATAAMACPSYSAFSRARMLRVTCQKFTATRSGPMNSFFCSGRSAAVTIAFTPGRAAALVVSIFLIRACACGERSTLPYSMPGSFRSAPYIARPVTFGTPSGRIGRVPTHLKRLTESVTIVEVVHGALILWGLMVDRSAGRFARRGLKRKT